VLLLVFLPVLNGTWRQAAVTGAVVMVLATGFSRIALGVHYPSDVVGGFVLGAAWVAATAAAFNAMGVDRGRRAVDVREGLEPEQAPRLAGRANDDERSTGAGRTRSFAGEVRVRLSACPGRSVRRRRAQE
jgi:undecaprenyl-diphosphatase